MNQLLDNQLLSADDVLLEPQLGILRSRSEAILQSFIYSAPMDTVTGYTLAKALLKENEIPIICREIPDEEYCACLRDFHNTSAFFAIGATEAELRRFIERMGKTVSSLSDDTRLNVAIDIAHGDSIVAYSAIKFLREYPFINSIMSGSICTPAAALRSVKAGCTHLRVGVGPGSVCTTRIMTGVGVPQLSAVYLIHRELAKENLREDIEIISDGGIRYPGDAVKYLAAGADAVMMGSVFSKALEAKGWIQLAPEMPAPNVVLSFPLPEPELRLVKSYRGHASADFQNAHRGQSNRCPEGTSTSQFKWTGDTVESICEKYRGGLASAISYLGIKDMKDLDPSTIKFMKITTSTFMESMPHNQEVNDVRNI